MISDPAGGKHTSSNKKHCCKHIDEIIYNLIPRASYDQHQYRLPSNLLQCLIARRAKDEFKNWVKRPINIELKYLAKKNSPL